MEFLKKLYKKYEILKEINPKVKDEFEENLTYKKVNALEYIKTMNSSCEGVPFVISGEINIFRINKDGEETNLYNMKSGDFCHEALSCILSIKSLDIVAKAIYDSEIVIIPINIFKDILLKDIKFIEYIYINLYEKFKGLIDEKEKILHEPLDERLWKRLTLEKGKFIYITHEGLAKELSTSREVISRKLKKLEKENKVKLSRGKIEIL